MISNGIGWLFIDGLLQAYRNLHISVFFTMMQLNLVVKTWFANKYFPYKGNKIVARSLKSWTYNIRYNMKFDRRVFQ